MYCVFEDMRNFAYNDTSHTASRLINIMGIKVEYYNERYYALSAYMKAGSFSRQFVSDIVTHASNGYANAGGLYGTMDISLSDNQIRFKTNSNLQNYLAGRTYYYILCWG